MFYLRRARTTHASPRTQHAEPAATSTLSRRLCGFASKRRRLQASLVAVPKSGGLGIQRRTQIRSLLVPRARKYPKVVVAPMGVEPTTFPVSPGSGTQPFAEPVNGLSENRGLGAAFHLTVKGE